MDSIGPSPLPDKMYASRHMPVQRVFFWLGRMLLAAGVMCLMLAMAIVALYKIQGGDVALQRISHVLPLPAMKVNGTYVLIREMDKMQAGWTQLYTAQGAVDFANSTVVTERVEDRLIRSVLVDQALSEQGQVVTEDDIRSVYNEFVGQYQTEAHLIESVDRQFGWSVSEFEEFIVKPLASVRVLDDYVDTWVEAQSQPRSIIEDIHMKVFTSPEIFSEVARDLSTSLSASDGGELGMRPIDEYPVEARDLLLSVEFGEISPILELENRFVIYQLIDRTELSDGFIVNAREIAIDKRDVYDILREYLEAAEIKKYLE